MVFSSSKSLATLTSLFLMFAIAFSLVALPAANAHDPPWKILTSSFIHVAPNPVGVGQTVNVGFWVNQPPPTANNIYGDRFGNMTVEVTHPDGTTETLGPFTSDNTGGTFTPYTPAQVGVYTFQFFFGGWTLTNPEGSSRYDQFIGDVFLPSTSEKVSLTVQNEPIQNVPLTPLPTDWWEPPINAMNVQNWYSLAGSSLLVTGYSTSRGAMYNGSSNYNPYTTAPKTAHILWTSPVAFGGVLGGQFGGSTTYGNYYSTSQYEHKFEAIIMNGFLYYTQFPGSSTNPVANICVDLRTGETVWVDDATNYGGGNPTQTALTADGLVTPLYYGQILDFVSPNQYGGLAYIWTQGTLAGIDVATRTTTYNMFDAMTGKYILSIVNGTGMSMTWDKSGNLVGYYINNTDHTLNKWNSTLAITNDPTSWMWRPPQNGQISFSNGIMWSQPIATDYNSNALPGNLGIRDNDGDTIVMNVYAEGTSSYYKGGWGIFAGYSATTGQQLWIKNITVTPYGGDVNTGASVCANGVFTISLKSDFEISGYSMTTGDKLWTTPLRGDNGSIPDTYSTAGGYCSIADDHSLYYAGLGGDIWSIDMLTGDVNWYTNTTKLQGSAGLSNPYGIWPIWTFSNGGVADGVLFLAEGHEYSPPLFLGAQQLAINTTTGELVWSIDAFNVDSHPATAYGVMLNLNAYDNQIYAYGKGPSKTTVTVPSTGVTTSTPITIKGTVTDISAGAQQHEQAANFPNGLPAVSDDSMTPWMEYVYMQQVKPTDVKGVLVSIDVLDSNGNYRNIGTVTSDADGSFHYTWTPDISGDFTVYASFAGSESYWPSRAVTSFTAEEAPQSTPAPTPTPASMTDTYIIAFGTAMLIAIIVGFIVLILLRKR
jgi:hypothetical protein